MVDRDARSKAADVLERFRDGHITNRQYEKAWPWKSDDPGLNAAYRAISYYYCDITKHKLTGEHALDDRSTSLFNRCVLYLRSDIVYDWDGDPGDEDFLWDIPETMRPKSATGNVLFFISVILLIAFVVLAYTESFAAVPMTLILFGWFVLCVFILILKTIMRIFSKRKSHPDETSPEIDFKPQMKHWPFQNEEQLQQHSPNQRLSLAFAMATEQSIVDCKSKILMLQRTTIFSRLRHRDMWTHLVIY